MKRRKNSGFTLIELLVVAAILGICTAIISYSISTVYSMQAKKCATSLDALLSRTKLDVMSKADGGNLRIYVDGDGNIIAERSVTGEKDVLGNFRCNVYYNVTGSGDYIKLNKIVSTGDVFYLTYDRSTSEPRYKTSAGAGVSWTVPSSDIRLKIEGGGRAYVITIYAATGAHTMEGTA